MKVVACVAQFTLKLRLLFPIRTLLFLAALDGTPRFKYGAIDPGSMDHFGVEKSQDDRGNIRQRARPMAPNRSGRLYL